MKIKKYITGSVLFLAMLACAVPGLSQPAIPTFDPKTIPTIIVLTANAAISQTAAASPPTPFETATAVLAPAEAIAATPRISSLGTSLLLRDDKTTVFTDRQTGIELTVPAGWVAVRINEQEYYDAWVLPEFSDQAFQNSLTSMKNLDPSEFRLFALDVQEGHLQGGFVTNVNVLWSKNENISLDNDRDLQDAADSILESTPGLDILTKDISVNVNGVPIGVITSKIPATTLNGTNVVVFYKMLFIKARTGVVMITLTTIQELRDAVLPAFDVIFETVKIVAE